MPSPGHHTGGHAAPPFRIKSLIWSVYAPTFLLSIAQGILVPILPYFAKDELLATDFMVGIAIASKGIGTMMFDVPAGLLVSRIGLKNTMMAGVALFGLTAIAAGLSPSLGWLVAARLLAGASFALWSISRHTYIASAVPVQSRGRALSMFGGISRIASVIGPFIGGFLAELVDIRAPFFAQAAVAGGTMALVFFTMRSVTEVRAKSTHSIYASLGHTLSAHRHEFATAGIAAVTLQFMRAAREFIIPLWGYDIGLTESEIGIVTGVSFAVDASMFPLVGFIMDRFGRKWAGVPAFLVLGASMATIPLSDSFVTLMLSSMLAGLGNGLSSGFVLTLGTDFSPRENAGEFLGVWRLISDTGGATGPLAIGALAQAVTLATASLATAGMGGFGACVLIFLVRETLVKRRAEAVISTGGKLVAEPKPAAPVRPDPAGRSRRP